MIIQFLLMFQGQQLRNLYMVKKNLIGLVNEIMVKKIYIKCLSKHSFLNYYLKNTLPYLKKHLKNNKKSACRDC